jgi:uncharacterized membrane protein YfcA
MGRPLYFERILSAETRSYSKFCSSTRVPAGSVSDLKWTVVASIFFAIYLEASRADKHAFRATLSAMLMALSVARALGYAAVDELTLDSFLLCAAALPAMGLGLLVGDRIHSGLSQRAFQRVVCAALFLCGVPLLLK